MVGSGGRLKGHGTSRALRLAAVLFGAVVCGAGLPLARPAPTSAAWSDSAVSIEYPVGDVNRAVSVYLEDPRMVDADQGHASGPNGIVLQVFGATEAEFFDMLNLNAPVGEALAIGTYHFGSAIASSGDPTAAHLNLSRECNAFSSGWFRIDDIAWSGSTLDRLSVDIVCIPEDGFPVAAQFRYHSQRPIVDMTQSLDELHFPVTLVGQVSASQAVTLHNRGGVPVTVNAAAIAHVDPLSPNFDDATDFAVVSDGCRGRTLVPGDSCSVSVRFAPHDRRLVQRYAFLEITDSTLSGVRRVGLFGQALRLTRLTITPDAPVSVRNEAQAPIRPVLDSGVGSDCWFTPQFTWFVDGALYGTSSSIDAERAAITLQPLGQHRIQARYDGSQYCAPAVSNEATQLVVAKPEIEWSVYEEIDDPGTFWIQTQPSTVVDQAHPDTGATFTLHDDTSGLILAEIVLPSFSTGGRGISLRHVPIVGVHTLRATYSGVAPLYLPAESTYILTGQPDLVPPTATVPVASLVGKVVAGTTSVPVKLAWNGTDTDSGVAGYDLEQRVDGGAWTALTTNTHSRSITVALDFGHTYNVRVRAIDGSGNVGAWVQSPPIFLNGYSEHHSRIAYRGTWRDTRSASYQGGADRYATASTARATFHFVGRSVEWVSAIGPTRGTARVYVDGAYVGTVNLYAKKTGVRRIVWSRSWTGAGSHTVVIRVSATKGHPRADLDTLVVLY